ncbi:MAG: ParB/RepB/Spo0J family partition protein, partial [Sphingobacteriales bacterium]
MTFTAATVLEGEFKMVPISAIRLGNTNPRKFFHEGEIEELAVTIKKVGLIAPILVRPVFGENYDYELVCGETRYKAHLFAELERISAQVRHLTDDDAYEIQIIENLQRKNISAIEEAHAFEQLSKRPNYNYAEVARRVGKSDRYITERIRLLKLIDEFQQRLFTEEINIGQAITIAKFQPHHQKMILERGTRWNDGVFKLSTKELWDFIRNNILMELSAAPWKKDDEELYPEAGACKTCEKRTGFSQQLFAELSDKDRCTDAVCFKEKRFLFIEKKAQRLTRENEQFYFVADEYSPSQETKDRFPGMLAYNNYRKLDKHEASCDHVEKGLC